jgi:hypothetical protein
MGVKVMAFALSPVLMIWPNAAKPRFKQPASQQQTDEDGVGSCVWCHLLGARSGHAIEQGHSELRAVGHGGDRGASDGGEELGEGVNRA